MSKIEVDAIVPQSGTTLTVGEAGDTVDISNATLSANLNANNLTSGTIPDARFPATLPAVDGSNLTNVQIAGGYTACDAITVTNTDTFALTAGGSAVSPESANNCIVSLNGVIQAPGTSYTISGSNIVFASALSAGSDVIDFITVLGTALNVGTVSDGTIGLAKLSATGTKDSTTFLRGDNTFATPSSDYVLLATTDASSSASVSFDGYFSSTYKNYKIIGSYIIPATDAAEVRIRFRKSNADVTTSNYSTVVQHAQGDSGSAATFGSRIWNGDSFKLGNASLDNAASSGGANFELTIYNPLDTNSYKWFTSNSAYINSSLAEIYTHNQSGWLNDATTALSGISFFMSSGNITSGNFKLYGLK